MNIRSKLHDPAFTTRFHKWATLAWILLAIPTLMWWRESVLWVALMSIWANVASHWAAYQASRAEQNNGDSNGDSSNHTRQQDDSGRTQS